MGIDFDDIAKRLDKALVCLNNLPQPYSVRISSGGEGIHIILSFDDKIYRELYDDPERLKVDKIRAKYGLTGNILDDVKSIGKERRISGKWVTVDGLKFKNKEELEKFIIEMLK